MKSAWFVWGSVGLGLLGVSVNTFPVQAEPAPVFAPILSEVRQRLPQGLQMRLPATLPDRPEPLYAFVRSSQQGLFAYLATEAGCNQPSCSVGGAAVFTEVGFASWERKLANATPIELPNGIQGHYLQQGRGEDADHYVIWQQDGSSYVIGTDNRTTSKQELMQIAASMVSEPAIR
ncbi:MAG: hypothetical protein IGS38_14570 [Synechococcales cyanobacterium M58_A2018_015]|nr:hypothetical protein [Synechococcales cyanobacterium M58_A2018_015]MBF2026966.1 hypothetical protein [Leptolyngbyaceae cyanobacterium C42_A2020_001]